MATATTPQPADRIETLGFSARTKNALRREHITTVGDLLTCDRNRLTDIRSFGPVCLDEVVRTLAAHGLELKPVTRYRPVEDIELPDTPTTRTETA
jgi:DNA-directed RNA polymerase alpha subunit